ncbi:MAG: PTS sugar transporter subunit IIA [Legionellales bacterium]|nr:PTS sugar transporter subunit IIA [Legionellales bacterium]
MNILRKLLSIDRVAANQPDNSYKKVFKHLSFLIATADKKLNSEILFDSFMQREKLGSTYLGNGIAIPHIRSTQIDTSYGALIQLENGIQSSQSDMEIVDLFFGFIVPENSHEEHLQILGSLTDKFNDSKLVNSLHSAENSHVLYKIATK